MPVTLEEIAKAAGVSRGTVDRALHDRGRIRPEVAAEIKKLALEMGYQPSRADKDWCDSSIYGNSLHDADSKRSPGGKTRSGESGRHCTNMRNRKSKT